jgi:hypothetical protein
MLLQNRHEHGSHRTAAVLSAAALMSETPDTLVKDARRGRTVYHVSRDSTAIEAREKAEKKPRKEEKTGLRSRKMFWRSRYANRPKRP